MTKRSFLVGVALLVFTGLSLAQQGELSFERYMLGENHAFLLAPQKPAKTEQGMPWVWYAPTFHLKLPGEQERWMIERLHAKGIAVAGVDVGESYGSPAGRAVFQKLYESMVARGYSTKPVLLARSRGGLMLYNWAAEHADCVAGIAGVYPVCNLASWPGLKKAAPAYEMTEAELKNNLKEHNPIDRLAPLAKAKVPLYHLHGDNDTVVPLQDNSALLAKRYQALGGPVTLEIIQGGGHDIKKHWFESQALTDFMIEQALR